MRKQARERVEIVGVAIITGGTYVYLGLVVTTDMPHKYMFHLETISRCIKLWVHTLEPGVIQTLENMILQILSAGNH